MTSKKKTSKKKTSVKRTSVKAPLTTAPKPARKVHALALDDLRAAVEVLTDNGFDTVTEAAIFCETITPQTLAAIVRNLDMPFSTASRIAYDLSLRDMIEYKPHETDRRKKYLAAKTKNLVGVKHG